MFSVSVEAKPKKSNLIFKVTDPTKVKTGCYPRTLDVLEKRVKSIFECQCFNDQGLPFKHEVKDTELAHLYEHILLEYLAEEKYQETKKPVKYKGVTKWNWKRDQRGVFTINLTIGKEDEALLSKAMDFAKGILNEIMTPTTPRPSFNPDVATDNGRGV